MSNTLIFYGDYTKAGAAFAPSSAPTIRVDRINRSTDAESSAVAGGTATVARGMTGRYTYRLTGADLSTYDYHARFTTTDTSVDAADVPGIWSRWSEAIASDSAGGVPLSVGTATGQLNVSGGKAPTTIAAGDIATDAITAASVKADAVTKVQAGLSTYAGGTVASVAAPVTVGTNTDKTGYGLSAGAVQAIWDALMSALTTTGSIGKKLASLVFGTDNKALLSTDAQPTIPANTIQWGGVNVGGMPNATAPLTSLGANAPDGWVRTATFAGGTTLPHVTLVDTATNLTNAPTAGDFTAAMKASLNAATPTVVLNFGQTGLTPRDLSAVADSALTLGDGLVAAICGAAGKESVSGTAYVVKTPSTGTVIRTFALDSSSAPTSRS